MPLNPLCHHDFKTGVFCTTCQQYRAGCRDCETCFECIKNGRPERVARQGAV